MKAMTILSCAMLSVQCVLAGAAARAGPKSKESSVFYPESLRQRVQANARKSAWAAKARERIVKAAEPWMKLSDDELWDMMFGCTIHRAWMVWSNGHCPACKKPVRMYAWRADALRVPWKMRCPRCRELFPKNDFHKFYRSGLDEHGVFDPKRADRALLFNAEHPDPKDPLHKFGVDDGEGYVAGGTRWRFIGAYLIYGQWKQAVHAGIKRLAEAYVATSDPAYAHKAGVLLDRVADVYPTFEFREQGSAYERPHGSGYVSTWHDACEETREMALAYDQVFDALRSDKALAEFLARKARQFKLPNPKTTAADVLRNIEDGILRDPIKNAHRIQTNYPRQPVALATIKAILGWPDNRDEVYAMIDGILERATAVDGVTGEKGLAGYATFTIGGLALLLAEWDRADPAFLERCLKRHPSLRQTYRFHIDTWCLHQYYPTSGDSGSFATRARRYCGVALDRAGGLAPSMHTLLWRLFELTGDAAYVQVLYHANGNSVKDLPYDLLAENPEAVQRRIAEVVAREGPLPRVGSVNKQQWHIAILRSGEGSGARAAWLDYDSGGGHSHADAMNLGLYARGLDLLPDFGYPPVQFGGWRSPRARWYTTSAAHNTVVVDGKNSRNVAARTTLWADGKQVRLIRASGPGLIAGKQFERTVAMVDVSERDFYLVDVFRVVGGTDHAKFTSSHFGQITTAGLSPKPAADYGHGTQMRHFRCDPAPQPGWSVDWKIHDRYKYLPQGTDLHLRYTDLTREAQASTCEAWVAVGRNQETWIPRVVVRRQAGRGPLASTFVSVIEPYEGTSNIAAIRRLPLETPTGAAYPEPNVAVEIELKDGRRDLFVAADAENPLGHSPSRTDSRVLVQKQWGLRLDGQACLVRRDAKKVWRVALCAGRSIAVGGVAVTLKREADFIEVDFTPERPSVVSGKPDDVQDIR